MTHKDRIERVLKYIKRKKIKAEIIYLKDKAVSAEDASRLSGFPVKSIIKTIIVIADGKPYAVLVTGDKRIDYTKLRKVLGCRIIRLANKDEVKRLTGFEIGEVSPLSFRLDRMTKVVDKELLAMDTVLLGAGSHNALVKMRTEELLKTIKPLIADVSK